MPMVGAWRFGFIWKKGLITEGKGHFFAIRNKLRLMRGFARIKFDDFPQVCFV